MKEYLALCLKGESTILERKVILDRKKEQLESKMKNIQKSLDYIAWEQNFYDDVISGKVKYYSNLINVED